MINAKLTLVGAGPGDPELISLKGIKALQEADVVLYDALVHPELLEYAKPTALVRYVGKRAGRHSYSQPQINKLIVEYALTKGQVVRLKGGDPFIFARGKEELEYAETFNIATESIPGISSINLPGCYGIPLTRRGINESFWVITATTSKGLLSQDVSLAAQSSATVVLLMGLRKIQEICQVFEEAGKAQLPIAIISKGSLPDGGMILGTIKNIQDLVRANKPLTPAIMVIGEAVGTHPEFYVKVSALQNQYLESHD